MNCHANMSPKADACVHLGLYSLPCHYLFETFFILYVDHLILFSSTHPKCVLLCLLSSVVMYARNGP